MKVESRDTENISNRHRTMTNKTEVITQKTKTMKEEFRDTEKQQTQDTERRQTKQKLQHRKLKQ